MNLFLWKPSKRNISINDRTSYIFPNPDNVKEFLNMKTLVIHNTEKGNNLRKKYLKGRDIIKVKSI